MNRIYYAKIDSLYQEDVYQNYYNNLPSNRQKRVNNYVDHEDQIRSVAAFTLLIKLLKDENINYLDTDFKIDENGKMYLTNSNIHFNLSHSGNYVIAGISDQLIGVDVEHVDEHRDIKKIINYVLDENEIKEFNKANDQKNYFYLAWTKKESYIKCVGKGLSMGMATINLSKLKEYQFICFEKENHQFAICVKGKLVANLKEIKL